MYEGKHKEYRTFWHIVTEQLQTDMSYFLRNCPILSSLCRKVNMFPGSQKNRMYSIGGTDRHIMRINIKNVWTLQKQEERARTGFIWSRREFVVQLLWNWQSNHGIHKRREISLRSERLAASQEEAPKTSVVTLHWFTSF